MYYPHVTGVMHRHPSLPTTHLFLECSHHLRTLSEIRHAAGCRIIKLCCQICQTLVGSRSAGCSVCLKLVTLSRRCLRSECLQVEQCDRWNRVAGASQDLDEE